LLDRRGRSQPAEGRVPIVDRELAFLDELAEALLDRPARAIEQRLRDVDERDGEAGLRKYLGDAVAHRPRADDADCLYRR
jgi:hypothetical protein